MYTSGFSLFVLPLILLVMTKHKKEKKESSMRHFFISQILFLAHPCHSWKYSRKKTNKKKKKNKKEKRQ
ncbi:hypothetical protein BCR41DRAFT_112591 [Lobosporangium transversale]|uniref:Uncharacterized protein n=1 Tax=Lobosporangium transversale TaxID=64571 RepID=A0A1Y2GHU7_9FUNG|nr:hypothetical protein BCR41DRAFT_112591 [Lobosporangium transversale]ORZ11379.1 hypothetical protein BCR41DRAFT_112591 [Lobosporangium transversale]|eukprot:XP_021879694.1 hypothetical protein BCR41DRAFT_112591 [Lobosporangium transversale]